jgi:hypothetical protein
MGTNFTAGFRIIAFDGVSFARISYCSARLLPSIFSILRVPRGLPSGQVDADGPAWVPLWGRKAVASDTKNGYARAVPA